MSPDSALIGHTVRQMRFRTYYEGVVLAIHRQVRGQARWDYGNSRVASSNRYSEKIPANRYNV
mgnify:CR=1 FL=1